MTRVPTFTPTRTFTRVPTRTRTATIVLPVGPFITHLGVARADGTVEDPVDQTDEGIPIYERRVGSGFLLVVEARSGTSGRPPGRRLVDSDPEDPTVRPDLQIEANRNLGNGSPLVCDQGPPPALIGGVPGIDPPSYEMTQEISDALNDFGCRFDVHLVGDEACTKDRRGNYAFVAPYTTTQYCTAPALGVELALPSDDTLFTAQLRDTGGNIGNRVRIIIRAP